MVEHLNKLSLEADDFNEVSFQKRIRKTKRLNSKIRKKPWRTEQERVNYIRRLITAEDSPRMQVTIGGLTYNALIDSDATQCFIGEHMLTKTGCLPDYIQEAPPNMKVCAVGIEHTPVGQITLCIKWHNQLTPMNFFILPKGVCSLIIGHNFMRRVHLNMHPGEEYFSCTRIPGLIISYVPYSEGFREASLKTIFVYNTELSQDPNWDEKLLTGSNCTAEQCLALKEILTSVKGVFSDKPGCFDGLYKEFCAKRNITMAHTSTYTPHSNPTERVNRDIKTMLAIYTDDTLPCYSTREEKPPLPFDLRILYHGISLDKNKPEEYVKELLDILKRAHQNMYYRMQKNYEKYEKVHNDKYHICEYELGDLVWRKTHIISDKDNNITKGLAIKRDGPWEITKIHGDAYELTKIENRKIEKSINTQDLLSYIPSYSIEEWEENQLVGTNTEHPNPNWMSEKNSIQQDIIIPGQPEIQVEQTNSSTPDVKTQGRHHKKHLKREAKRNGTYVPPVKPPNRRPRTRKPNRKYIDGFVTKKKSASREPRTPKEVLTGTTPATSTEVTIPTAPPASSSMAPIQDLSSQVDYWRQQAQALLQQQQQPPPNGYYQQGFGQYSAHAGLQPLAQIQLAPRNQIRMEPVIESAPSVSSAEEPKEPMPEEAIDWNGPRNSIQIELMKVYVKKRSINIEDHDLSRLVQKRDVNRPNKANAPPPAGYHPSHDKNLVATKKEDSLSKSSYAADAAAPRQQRTYSDARRAEIEKANKTKQALKERREKCEREINAGIPHENLNLDPATQIPCQFCEATGWCIGCGPAFDALQCPNCKGTKIRNRSAPWNTDIVPLLVKGVKWGEKRIWATCPSCKVMHSSRGEAIHVDPRMLTPRLTPNGLKVIPPQSWLPLEISRADRDTQTDTESEAPSGTSKEVSKKEAKLEVEDAPPTEVIVVIPYEPP
uniref:Retropepsins domain-containing protein n=1 Tax=Strigamia maritima TaxID=126957 RepID=T1IMA5_STRMM